MRKFERVLAIVGLLFMLTFVVTMICYFVDPAMLSGHIGTVVLSSGGMGLSIWLYFFILRRQQRHIEDLEKLRKLALEKENAEKEGAQSDSLDEKNNDDDASESGGDTQEIED